MIIDAISGKVLTEPSGIRDGETLEINGVSFSFKGDYQTLRPRMPGARMYSGLSIPFQQQAPSLPTNCKNCGAPLTSSECEYCRTRYA